MRELVKHPKFNQLDIDLYDDEAIYLDRPYRSNQSPELLINMPSKNN
ncbi:FAD/NAD(P)-binding protein [Staphylococcus aureus]